MGVVVLENTENERARTAGTIIDFLVDALGGEPSSPLRRALILLDIDEFPGITQTDLLARQAIHKSSLNRDIDWLYDHGCILRRDGVRDGRITHLYICGYAKKNLDYALGICEGSSARLRAFLQGYLELLNDPKATLRDARIIAAMAEKGNTSKADIIRSLYNGPASTDSRAIKTLLNSGLLEEERKNS